MEIDLERDLVLSEEDLESMRSPRGIHEHPPDLLTYLAFLEEIRAFYVPKPLAGPFSTDFVL